jgi:hypothetical protein
MSHEHMLTRALVMLALAESIGMPRLLAQTVKMFEEEAATVARFSCNSGVWILVLTSNVAKVEYLVLMTLIWLLYNKYAWSFENWYQSGRTLWITVTSVR